MNFAMYEGRLTDTPFFRAGEETGGENTLRIKDKLPDYLRNKSYIQFTVASDNTRGDTEKTMYITCSVYGALADELNKCLYQGVKVIVSGTPYDYDGGGIRNNRGLILTDCEIIQHTLAYTTKHKNVLDANRDEEIERQQSEYKRYLSAQKSQEGRPLTPEEIEEIEANRLSKRRRRATEEEVQGYKTEKTPDNQEINKNSSRPQSWDEIEKELMADEGAMDFNRLRNTYTKKSKNSLDLEEDEDGFIKVDEGFQVPWEV